MNPHASYVEFQSISETSGDGLLEVVVTDLLNYGMPMIRYKINDCVEGGWKRCSCGRGYPLIRGVTGRTGDNFYLSNGDVVPGVSLTNRVIKACPGLKKTQIVQETMDSIRLRFVRGRLLERTTFLNCGGTLTSFWAVR